MLKIKPAPLSALPPRSNLVVFCFEKKSHPVAANLFGSSINSIFETARKDGFTGKRDQSTVIHSYQRKISRAIFIGLGNEKEADLESIRRGVGVAVRTAQSLGLNSLNLRLPKINSASLVAQAAAEGAILAQYTFDLFRGFRPAKPKLKALSLISKNGSETQKFKQGIALGTVFALATNTARNLINTPPSDMTPDTMVKKARTIAKRPIRLRVYNKSQLQKKKMGGILGVNRGSSKPPFFLHFVYKPGNRRPKKVIGICGKGITFDSGGLSLKPPKAMETMKMDMAGAATVLSLFEALGKLRPQLEVHGFTPLTENMPGGRALKPGDVLTAMNGKTIEVLNTDAEGRLVLADALSFASQIKLDHVLDVATLTGACTVALGNSITGVMGNDSKLIDQIREASHLSGEKVWELPLEKEYDSHIQSPIADIKNMGRPMQAGTIIGAIFLKHFVREGLSWAHLDIASTAWTESPTPTSRIGATGSIVRTLLHHIMSYN